MSRRLDPQKRAEECSSRVAAVLRVFRDPSRHSVVDLPHLILPKPIASERRPDSQPACRTMFHLLFMMLSEAGEAAAPAAAGSITDTFNATQVGQWLTRVGGAVRGGKLGSRRVTCSGREV